MAFRLHAVSLLGTFDPKSKEPEIEDPMNQGSVEFDRCYSRIRRCIMHYIDTTTEIPEAPNHALQRTGGAVTPPAFRRHLATTAQASRPPAVAEFGVVQ